MRVLCASIALIIPSLLPAEQSHPPLRAAERLSAEALLKKAYRLEPHMIKDDAVFKAYDAEIAAVWETAKARSDEFTVALRKLLPGEGMIPYFYYDGALLLVSLDPTNSNYDLAASCLVKGDPRDVRGEPHLRALIQFGQRGLDVTDAALEILDHDYEVFLVNHVINLGQDYCFIYAVSQLPVDRVLEAVTKRLERPMSDTAKATVALWAYYAATPKANELLVKLAAGLPKGEAHDLLRKKAARVKPGVTLTPANQKSLDELRQSRQEMWQGLSDEALGAADTITDEMRKLLGDSE